MKLGKCETCEHCKLDELWGEHKCLVHHHAIYIPIEECKEYEPKKKGENK